MAKAIDLDGYVTVAERLTAFYERYPEGSIQSELLELTDQRVVIRASAYRSPEDARPGIGHASMLIPGSTAFTRGSELENTESSAWGRALAALGFETKRGIASADEIRNKAGSSEPRSRGAEPAIPIRRDEQGNYVAQPGTMPTPRELTVGETLDLLREYGLDTKAAGAKGRELYGEWQLKAMTGAQRSHVVEELLAQRAAGAGAPPPLEEDDFPSDFGQQR